MASLEKAMEVTKRDDGTEFACFSDHAPEELRGLFLKHYAIHYSVRDIDYKIFSDACDAVTRAWNDVDGEKGLLREWIDDNCNEFASIYNAERLAYLSVFNDDEVADTFRSYACESISMACAYWYDNKVKDAMRIIIDGYLKIK